MWDQIVAYRQWLICSAEGRGESGLMPIPLAHLSTEWRPMKVWDILGLALERSISLRSNCGTSWVADLQRGNAYLSWNVH